MVNNSETLKNLNGIKPDLFLHDFRVIHSAINEFSDSENGPAAYSLHQAGNENMKISLMEYQRLWVTNELVTCHLRMCLKTIDMFKAGVNGTHTEGLKIT